MSAGSAPGTVGKGDKPEKMGSFAMLLEEAILLFTKRNVVVGQEDKAKVVGR
jgi:hypothetical protein